MLTKYGLLVTLEIYVTQLAGMLWILRCSYVVMLRFNGFSSMEFSSVHSLLRPLSAYLIQTRWSNSKESDVDGFLALHCVPFSFFLHFPNNVSELDSS